MRRKGMAMGWVTCLVVGLLTAIIAGRAAWRSYSENEQKEVEEKALLALKTIAPGVGNFLVVAVLLAIVGNFHLIPTRWEMVNTHQLRPIVVDGGDEVYVLTDPVGTYHARYVVSVDGDPFPRVWIILEDSFELSALSEDDSTPRLEVWRQEPRGYWGFLSLGGHTIKRHVFIPLDQIHT